MKTRNILTSKLCLFAFFFLLNTQSFGQLYTSVIQDFESEGNGSDGCWTGFNLASVPSTNSFFTVSSPVHNGLKAGGFYSCCGGPANNNPSYYISPVLPAGDHPVVLYIKQSSTFSENFEIGTTTNDSGTNFISSFSKSLWPSPSSWERISTLITTNSSSNRIAFRIPSSSIKTYYLDSIAIGLAGAPIPDCNFIIVGSSNSKSYERNDISISPNPFNDVLFFRTQNNEKLEFTLFDLRGKLQFQEIIGQSRKLEIGPIQNGLYIFTIKGKQHLKSGKLLKIE